MKNLNLVLLLLCFSSLAIAQSIFTNTMVYNFSVNDTFVYQHTIANAGGVSLKVITSKNYSANGDTVKYGTSIFQRGFGAQTYSTSYAASEIYYDLDDTLTASLNFPNATYGKKDSAYQAYCNQLTYEAESYPLTPIFEPNYWKYEYVAGLGKVFYYEFIPATLSSNASYNGKTDQLIYYHKAGGAPCGDKALLTVGIQPQRLKEQAPLLYPNPVQELLHLDSPGTAIQTIDLADQLGRLYRVAGSADGVNMSSLKSGVYYLVAVNQVQVRSAKIVKLD